jgi:hypothetical protein
MYFPNWSDNPAGFPVALQPFGDADRWVAL